MTAHEYQIETRRTRPAGEARERALMHYAIGLCEETGEVAGVLKKHLFYGQAIDRDRLVKEAGDALWYLTSLADTMAIPLEGPLTSGVFVCNESRSQFLPRNTQIEEDLVCMNIMSNGLIMTARAMSHRWIDRPERAHDDAAAFSGALSGLLSLFDITLETVMVANVEKRRLRFPNGFTPADAAERKDEANG